MRAVLHPQSELLAGASEAGPIQQIKIALRQFNKTDQLVNGAEAGAETQRASPFLLHFNRQIFASRDSCVFRISFDFGKVAQVFQALFTSLHPHGVEDIARRDQNLTADHLVLGAGVAHDIDPLNKEAVAFFDLVMDIDAPWTGWRALRHD